MMFLSNRDRLIRALSSKDRESRAEAARKLGDLGAKEAVPQLILLLKDESMLVREMAAYALGRLKDSSAIQPLIDALHSKEENNEFVLRQVTSALIEIGYLSIHYLIAALKENNDRQLREACAWVLDQLGVDLQNRKDETAAFYWLAKPGGWETCIKLGEVGVKAVLLALKRGWLSREEVIQSCEGLLLFELGVLGKERRWAIAWLLDQLGWTPPEDDKKLAACYWIAKQRWDRCVSLGHSAIDALIRVLTHDKSPEIQSGAKKALQDLGWLG
jgi:hypothetical protein